MKAVPEEKMCRRVDRPRQHGFHGRMEEEEPLAKEAKGMAKCWENQSITEAQEKQSF